MWRMIYAMRLAHRPDGTQAEHEPNGARSYRVVGKGQAARNSGCATARSRGLASEAVYVDVRRTVSARGPFGPSPTVKSTESPSRSMSMPSP